MKQDMGRIMKVMTSDEYDRLPQRIVTIISCRVFGYLFLNDNAKEFNVGDFVNITIKKAEKK